MSDRTVQPVGDRSGQPGEHKSSEAQIRTLLDEQKVKVLAEAMIERGNTLLKQVKNKTLNTHRLKLFWTDRKSKSSPNVRRSFESTNSRLIMTEEVFKS